MTVRLKEISTITAKGQTTVPKSVRQALGVDYGGRIEFQVNEAGVTLHRVDETENDPVIGAWLDFLARDMQENPNHLKPLTPELATRIADLTAGLSVDLDAPITGDVDL